MTSTKVGIEVFTNLYMEILFMLVVHLSIMSHRRKETPKKNKAGPANTNTSSPVNTSTNYQETQISLTHAPLQQKLIHLKTGTTTAM